MSELRYTKDGVPIYDGTSESYVSYRRAALVYVETLEWKKRPLAGPRLQAALEGSARVAVQHKVPGWVSHQEGAVALLDFLKSQVQTPTLAEAGKMISRFFYSVKRRRGETMQQWIVRHDEALFEARRALAEAIEEYGQGEHHTPSASNASTATLPTSRHRRQAEWSTAASEPSDGPFQDNGRMREELGEDGGESEAQHSQWGWWDRDWSSWHDDGWNSRQWWPQNSWSHYGSGKYEVSQASALEADRFMPDFVVAWMLLQRSGLDSSERGTIVGNLRNKFTTENVKAALRLAWPEEDLRKRDQSKGSALMMDLDDFEDAMVNDMESITDEDMQDWPDRDREEYGHLCSDVESAFQTYQHARRTLRDARERQSMYRKNRQFYPMKKENSHSTRTEASATVQKCFKCGGNHSTSRCPEKSTDTSSKSAHFVFSVSGTSEPVATAFSSQKEELGFSLDSIVNAGHAIIDGGATSSVGSVEALEKIIELQRQSGFSSEVEVEPSSRPNFRFGNNGRKQCLSTTTLSVPLNDQQGSMRIHVHDIEGQPVLLSVAALRALKATIDFEHDEMILKAVDPSRIIQLERAASGHQLFPLAADIMSQSTKRSSPFHSLHHE